MHMLQMAVMPKHCGTVEEGVKIPLWDTTAKKGVGSGMSYEPVGRADQVRGVGSTAVGVDGEGAAVTRGLSFMTVVPPCNARRLEFWLDRQYVTVEVSQN